MIELGYDGMRWAVNPEQIAAIEETTNGTLLHMTSGKSHRVANDFDAILDKIDEWRDEQEEQDVQDQTQPKEPNP